jgi:Lipoxygenase
MAVSFLQSWTVRRFIWDTMFIMIFKGKEAKQIPLPVPTKPPIQPVPMSARIPAIQIRNILVADRITEDEKVTKIELAYALRQWMYKNYPANQPGLPQIDANIDTALKVAFTPRYEALYDHPLKPVELYADKGHVDLGAMALNSPYACYLTREDDHFVWDFSDLKNHSLNEGLVSPACKVVFQHDPAKPGQVRATEIDCALGKIHPGDAAWPDARRIAMCAASTQVTLVRHFNWVHLACGAHFAIATRNRLDTDHPICRLVWPHMFGTQNSNYFVSLGQMLPNGEFETIFSFDHAGMCDLFARTHNDYRISLVVPELDWEDRGLAGSGLQSPVQDNMVDLYKVMHAHAARYINHYYPSDAALRADGQVINWLAAMDSAIPNGIQRISGPISPAGLTREGLAQLVAGMIYMAAVQHEALGSVMWNYQLWVDENPVRIYQDGRRPPVDIYQRLLNANFNLNVRRAKLLYDFSYMGLGDQGAKLFKAFYDDLITLENTYIAKYQPKHALITPDMKIGDGKGETPYAKLVDHKFYPPWIVLPSAIDANINA